LLARLKRAVSAKRLTDQLDTAENLLFALARMVEAKDETTGEHCSRLMHMGMAFGHALGLSERDKDALRRGGILHDIGKLGIPDSILLKAGALNEEEWVLMRTHTVIGGHLCNGLISMRDVAPIIMHHHERWDGSGYPYGLKGKAIPLLARVFQILDIYDALASIRPYKPALTLAQIIAIFEEEAACGWRDPDLVRVFLHLLKTNPEQLSLPRSHQATEDERIFQSIAATGVIDWDRNKKAGAA
jgi:putative two-component system response regulator